MKTILFVIYMMARFSVRFRSGLAPFFYALIMMAIGYFYADDVSPLWWLPMWAASTVSLALWFFGEKISEHVHRVWLFVNPRVIDDGGRGILSRTHARAFLCILIAASGGWFSFYSENGWTSETWTLLEICTISLGAAWWYYHGWRRRKPFNKYALRWHRIAQSELTELRGWQNSKVVAVAGTRTNPVLTVRLKRGRTIKSVGDTAPNVASAQGLRPGAVTVMKDPDAEARVRVRIVPRDPWRGTLLHPLPAVNSLQLSKCPFAHMGKFEDAQHVKFKLLQHMLVVGKTGSGKSVWLESLLAWILAHDDAVAVAADLASGATFGIWENVFAAPLATTMTEAEVLLRRVFAEITYRERLLSQQKKSGKLIDVLATSPEFPALFFIIDEFPDLIKAAGPQVLILLERLAAKGRKVNVRLILGAQNPTAKDVGSTELRGAMDATIGLRLSNRQSRTLWESDMNEGWNSTNLMPGTFLVKDDTAAHSEPRAAKGLYIPPGPRLELIRSASSRPMQLNQVSRNILSGVQTAEPIGATASIGQYWAADESEEAEIIDAKVIRKPAEIDDLIWATLPEDGGIGPLVIMQKTELDRDAVNRSLKRMQSKGRVRNLGHGKWVQSR